MPALADRGATVNRLRIRCRLDPLTARLRASRLIDESALQPASLPPSAILCIRRLTDPRPGLFALDGAQRPSAMWTEAVAASVADLARRARRPGLGEATAGADAVLFADRAELLACLAADWCAGRLGALWWWQALFQNIGDARSVLDAWLNAPAYIAASFDELACRGGATMFVERLSPADARALLKAVVVQHGLASLSRAIEMLDRPDERRAAPPDGDGTTANAPRVDGGASTVDALPRAPWAQWVQECPAELRVDRQCLLAVALMTRRAPAVIRTVRFAAEFQRWLELVHANASGSDIASDPPAETSRTDRRLVAAASLARDQGDETPGVDRTDVGDPLPAPVTPAGRIEAAQTVRTFDPPPSTASVTRDKPVRWLGVAAGPARPATAGSVLPQFAARDIEAAVPRADVLPRHEHDRIASDVRAALAPERSAESAATRVDSPSSSVAPLDSPPASANVHEPPTPNATGIGSTSHEPSATNEERTRVAHRVPMDSNEVARLPRVYPASIETAVGGVFYLLNLALCLGLYGDFTTPLQRGIELSIWDFVTLVGRRLTRRRFRRDPVWALLADLAGRAPDEPPGATFAPLRRWLSELIPDVRDRLARALGERDRQRVGPLLCVQRARVVTTATHIDVMFSLAELPIAVRLSGLDRDPGWIPAADRVIAYHYD
jgi:hypothetical protein